MVVDSHEDNCCDRNTYKCNVSVRSDNSLFERVEQLKYLGTALTFWRRNYFF